MTDGSPFQYDVEVPPGEPRHLRHEVGETYPGDPVEYLAGQYVGLRYAGTSRAYSPT